jgi:hypothetical protein
LRDRRLDSVVINWYTLMAREYLVYQGQAFAIEWYFDERGRSQALEYFEALTEERQNDALALFKRMGDHGRIFDITKFRNEGDKLFAFKPQPDRYLCFFFAGRRIVIATAFEKKCQRLPQGEKRKALLAKSEYERRVRRGEYYEPS